MATVIVTAVLVLMAGIAVRKIMRDKKNGKSVQCGGDCSQCSGCCH